MMKPASLPPSGYQRPSDKTIDALIDILSFNQDGLVAALAQEVDTGEMLMMAWMNEEALRETLTTGRVCYWSRSRGKLWRKGETSGHIQQLVELRADCDGDALLMFIHQTGAACHTNRPSCFYRAVRDDAIVETAEPITD